MKAPTIKKLTLLSSLSALALAGCTAPGGKENARADRTDAQDRIQSAHGNIAANSPALTNAKATNRPSNITVKQGLFLGDTGFQASNGSPLPARFETEDAISMSLGGIVTIEQVAQAIEKATGIRVDYSDLSNMPNPYSEGGSDGESDSGNADSAGGDTSSEYGETGAKTEPQASDIDAYVHPVHRRFRVHHQGRLSDLLHSISSRLGVEWAYEGGRIRFLGPQTVTYTIWALPSEMETKSSIGAGGESNVFGGTTPATVSSSIAMNYWETFETGLASIVPGGNASHAINKSSGTIVVTAPMHIHQRVQNFIEAENMRLSRQVAVKLDVVAFTRNRGDSKTTSIAGLIDQASRGFSLDIASPVNSVEGGINIDAGIVSGPLSGINNVVSALSESGEVSILTSTTMLATNNTPTPVNMTTERAYLAGTTATEDQDGNVSTEFETGIISTGINAVITPRILSSGMVNLQYTLNMSELNELVEFSTPDGATTVQLPNTANRNFMQTVNVGSGKSLVIGSFDQQTSQDNGSGPFSPEFWGLGGKSEFRMDDTKVLIVMTPVVIEEQNSPTRR